MIKSYGYRKSRQITWLQILIAGHLALGTGFGSLAQQVIGQVVEDPIGMLCLDRDQSALEKVPTLKRVAQQFLKTETPEATALGMEFVLEGLHQHSMLSRDRTDGARTSYKDMLKSMLSGLGQD